MDKILTVAAGGVAGALARYGVILFFQRFGGTVQFPIAILTVNVIGSFLFGLLWSVMEERGWVSENVRLLALTGFLGSFTTFSTFAFDSATFAKSGSWGLFALNVVLNNALALVAVFVGFRVAKLF